MSKDPKELIRTIEDLDQEEAEFFYKELAFIIDKDECRIFLDEARKRGKIE